MQYKYLVFVDKRFRNKGKKELEKTSESTSFDEKEIISDKFVVAKLDSGEEELITKLGKSQPIFIENIISVIEVIDYKADDYNEIIALLESKLQKDSSIKLEVLNLNSKSAQNAKSTEVKIGQTLESDGFNVDLASPKNFIYIILSRNKALICKNLPQSPFGNTIDYFRKYNNKPNKVSRSEFKLEEAISYFELDTEKIKSAIDIGAAPGGWSKVFSGYGIRVTAIDNAPMVYNSPLINYVKANATKIDESAFGMADMLLIDANTDPKISSELAVKFAKRLNKEAHLLLTIKLVGGSVEKHIETAKETLSQAYTDIRFKKLPHNRMEITCFAKKKELK